MAAANLLALLDDITSMLDDVALMTKVAAQKTVGVLGNDLALNAQQVSGSTPNRELPVVLSVAKGSLINKAILIPLALLISAFAPWLISWLLMLGGTYLSYEGAEKIVEFWERKRGKTPAPSGPAGSPGPISPAEEKRKIRGAIRTGFILSTEIIVIALGSLPDGLPFWERTVVLCLVWVGITAGVYGVVAAIVKIDDAGLWLIRAGHGRGIAAGIGDLLVKAMPYLMRFLTVAGTLAMFLVGGGILAHGIPWLEMRIESLSGLFMPGIKAALLHMGLGLTAGTAVFGLAAMIKRFVGKKNQADPAGSQRVGLIHLFPPKTGVTSASG